MIIQNKFKIITPVYNAEKYIKKCIDSVKSQTYKNWEMVIVNACSTDSTKNIIEKEIEKRENITLLNNKTRQSALKNTIDGINYICKNDEDIIVILDGDDWLSDNGVLEHLNKIYQEDIWVTWGQFKLVSNDKVCKVNDKETWAKDISGYFNRRWLSRFIFSHLRTYKYFLFKGIKEEDLRDSYGNYYTTSGDVVVALPLIEMAGEKHRKFIKRVMYCYNDLNELNDMKKCPKKQIKIFDQLKEKEYYRQYKKVEKVVQNKNKLDIIVWTKDRACQLDLLLRSIKDNFDNAREIFVLIDSYSNEEFKKGYQKIITKNYGLNITFIEKEDFENDTKNIINNKIKTKFMVALCDDDCFIRKTNLDDILNLYTEEVCAISMRMGKNITYCYGTQKPSKLPCFCSCKGNYLKWKWEECDSTTDWGYPSAVNIHVYKTDWYRDVIKDLSFDIPNKLEYLFNTNRKIFKPYIVSYKETHVLNIPANQVQTLSPNNPYGKTHAHTLEELNDLFLNGKIIDETKIYNYNNISVNEELKLEFKEEK